MTEATRATSTKLPAASSPTFDLMSLLQRNTPHEDPEQLRRVVATLLKTERSQRAISRITQREFVPIKRRLFHSFSGLYPAETTSSSEEAAARLSLVLCGSVSATGTSEISSISSGLISQNSEDASPEFSNISPSLFERLLREGRNWCRYCGTTNGISWRPGPWGKKTLCNKHGCDYQGYGFSRGVTRLDLDAYLNENLENRLKPILQEYCQACFQKDGTLENPLISCHGCTHAYHQQCLPEHPTLRAATPEQPWFCSELCPENLRQLENNIILPSKHVLPLSHTARTYKGTIRFPRFFTPTRKRRRTSKQRRPKTEHVPGFCRRIEVTKTDIQIPGWDEYKPLCVTNMQQPSEYTEEVWYRRLHELYATKERRTRLLRPSILAEVVNEEEKLRSSYAEFATSPSSEVNYS